MNLVKRISLLSEMGSVLQRSSASKDQVIEKAISHNPWFTEESIELALRNIASYFLSTTALELWSSSYTISDNVPKKVGIIMAGNIPAVGFHDMLSVFISGHHNLIKLSDKDNVLIPYLVDELINIDPDAEEYFTFVEHLKEYDAVIATGSNTAGIYFERYFSSVPHIIRRNMNGVAILMNDTGDDKLALLGHDIFDFFGLGCRNVSKIYIEKGFDVQRIFEAILPFADVINHNKYKNNYDYNNALYLMNSEAFLTNNFLALKEDQNISSRISTVHYEYFEDLTVLEASLILNKDQIQCLVSDIEIEGFENIAFGETQRPKLDQYADNVDTMKFLTSLN